MPNIVRVPPAPNGRYPHFIEHDAKIWHRFLILNPRINCTVAYDVHVGTPSPAAADFPENYARMIETLSTKRIDVVMFFPKETHVVEVKPAAGTQAIGQALCYTTLFKQKYPGYPKIGPCIITDTAQPDINALCVTYDVLLIQTDLLR